MCMKLHIRYPCTIPITLSHRPNTRNECKLSANSKWIHFLLVLDVQLMVTWDRTCYTCKKQYLWVLGLQGKFGLQGLQVLRNFPDVEGSQLYNLTSDWHWVVIGSKTRGIMAMWDNVRCNLNSLFSLLPCCQNHLEIPFPNYLMSTAITIYLAGLQSEVRGSKIGMNKINSLSIFREIISRNTVRGHGHHGWSTQYFNHFVKQTGSHTSKMNTS